MTARLSLHLCLAGLLLVASPRSSHTPACCPVPPPGKAVVNADQTVIIVWDAASKTEHFIRQASFKSDAEDFGFLVPTPSQPELAEAGNDAFPVLAKLTAPTKRKMPRPPRGGIGCSEDVETKTSQAVHVVADKLVAGLHAVVLETKSSDALVQWLREHGYAFSPEVAKWAKPYVDAGWKITALRVAKDKVAAGKSIATAALRISFKTDRPLFPYREPDPKAPAQSLSVSKRILRIYFLAEARYRGQLSDKMPWSGRVAWANSLSPGEHEKTMELLKIQDATKANAYWLTEFEDEWAYRSATADVTFERDPNQDIIARDPIIEYVSSSWPTDPALYAFVGLIALRPVLRRFRAGRSRNR
jgi:hypothetical protein